MRRKRRRVRNPNRWDKNKPKSRVPQWEKRSDVEPPKTRTKKNGMANAQEVAIRRSRWGGPSQRTHASRARKRLGEERAGKQCHKENQSPESHGGPRALGKGDRVALREGGRSEKDTEHWGGPRREGVG